MRRLADIIPWTLAAFLSGCLTPWNTRLPTRHFESAQMQRRESQQQDPFPDDTRGPTVGARPPGFEVPRDDSLRTKNGYFSTILKQQYGPPPGTQVGPGAQYPEAVRLQ